MAGLQRTTMSMEKFGKTSTVVPDAGVSLPYGAEPQKAPARRARTLPASSEETRDVHDRLCRAQAYLQEGADVRVKLQGLSAVQGAIAAGHGGGAAVCSKMLRLVACALEDVNFAVLQGGLEVLEELVRCGADLSPHLDEVVGMLVPQLGGKYAVRQSVVRTCVQLMACVGPDLVLQKVIAVGSSYRSSRVREDTINVVLTALLTHPHGELDLLRIAMEIAPSLADDKQRVRLAALECLALLSHALRADGAQALEDVVVGVEESYLVSRPVETGGLVAAFKARVARNQLPSVNADGLVDHVVQVVGGGAGKARSDSGADVQWILLGCVSSSAGQNSPAEGGSRASSGVRPYNSAGTRNKLPWERDSERNASKLASLPPRAPKKPLPSLQRTSQEARVGHQVGGASKRQTANSYAELHRVRLRRMNMDPAHSTMQSPGVSLSMRREGERLTAVDHSFAFNGYLQQQQDVLRASVDVGLPQNWSMSPFQRLQARPEAVPDVSLSRTWPSTRPSPLPGEHTPAPTTVLQRPSSKPRVKHPLGGLQGKRPSAAEDSAMVQGKNPSRHVEDYEDDFEDIYDDQFEGSSLSSSMTSFAAQEFMKAARAVQEEKAQEASTGSHDHQVMTTSTATSKVEKGAMRVRPAKVKSGSLRHTLPESVAQQQKEVNVIRRGSSVEEGVTPKRAENVVDLQPRHLDSTYTNQPVHLHNPSAVADVSPSAGRVADRGFESSVLGWSSSPGSSQESGEGSAESDVFPSDNGVGDVELSWSARTKAAAPRGGKPCSVPSSATASPVPRKAALSKSAKERILGHKLRPLEKPRPPSGSLAQKPPLPPRDTPATEHNSPMEPKHFVVKTFGASTPPCETAEGEESLDELHPFVNPEQALEDALQGLGSTDWESKTRSLFAIRRLAMHHSEMLIPHLKAVAIATEEEVKNLRSAVSRAAIACLGDLFACLGRSLEPHLDSVVRSLLHKTGETSVFIREDCEKALGEMTIGVSAPRALMALVQGGASHKNATVRRSAAQLIQQTVELAGGARVLGYSREVVEAVLLAVVRLVRDNSPEARYFARKTLSLLWPCADFERASSRVLSPTALQQLNDAVELLRTKGVGEHPTDISSAKTRPRHPSGDSSWASKSTSNSHSASMSERRLQRGSLPQDAPQRKTSRPARRQRSLSDAQPLGSAVGGELSSVLLHLVSSDWSERYSAVAELEELIQHNPTAIGTAGVKIFDAFTPRLTDSNVKVNLHALRSFSRLIPLLGDHLSPVLPTILPALPITSKLAGIAPEAGQALQLMCQYVDPAHMVQPLTNLSQFTNPKAQPIVVFRLAEVVPSVAHTRLQQHVLPLLWRLLDSKMAANNEGKAALKHLCTSLHETMGQTLFDKASTLPPDKLNRLNRFLGAS